MPDPQHPPRKPSLFDRLDSKSSFYLGLGGALAVFFVIGFFVLLSMVIMGDEDAGTKVLSGTTPTATPSAPSPSVARPAAPSPSDISLAAVTNEDWVKGSRDAKVSVVEFSDLECPFCKRVHPTLQRLVDEYDGKVNWVYRHFPLSSLHAKASKEAEATECAGALGGNEGFWDFADRIFEITPSNDGLDLAQLPKIAEELGLDRAKFQDCLDSGKFTQKVQDHYNQANAAGGTGTPYMVVVAGDTKIPISGAVPYAQIKSVVDSVL